MLFFYDIKLNLSKITKQFWRLSVYYVSHNIKQNKPSKMSGKNVVVGGDFFRNFQQIFVYILLLFDFKSVCIEIYILHLNCPNMKLYYLYTFLLNSYVEIRYFLFFFLNLNPTWEGVQIPWIGGGGAKSAPPLKINEGVVSDPRLLYRSLT